MAVRQVMDHLPYGPAAGAVGRVELLGREPGDGGLQARRRLCDGVDALAAFIGSEDGLRGTSPDGVTQVLHGDSFLAFSNAKQKKHNLLTHGREAGPSFRAGVEFVCRRISLSK